MMPKGINQGARPNVISLKPVSEPRDERGFADRFIWAGSAVSRAVRAS